MIIISSFADLPWNGAERVHFWVRVRDLVLPVVAYDDQWLLRFPDGTCLYAEKWDCEPVMSSRMSARAGDDICDRSPAAVEGMKAEAVRRLRSGLHRNRPCSEVELRAAVEKGIEDEKRDGVRTRGRST